MATEGHDDRRIEHLQLAAQVWLARGDLVGLGVAVVGWAALDDVGDEHILAAPADRAEQPHQQVTGAPDERPALAILVETRPFANEDDLGRGIALPGDGLRPGLVEATARAGPDLPGDDLERRLALGPRHAVPPPAGSATGPW
jgi:hypothetical protein